MQFTISTTLDMPYDAAVAATRAALASTGEGSTVVEAFDPDAMMGLAGAGALDAVATDAKQRLTAALAALVDLSQED